MKAARVHGSFGLDNLTVSDVEEPVPGSGEVLIRIRAASLNYRDYLVVTGKYNPTFPLPLTIGSDCVGEVVALGEGAEALGVTVGQRVCPIFAQGWLSGLPRRDATRRSLGGPLSGVFAEYTVVRADSVVPIPEYLSDVEAACLPCAALTAWSALVTLSKLEPDHTLLTLGTGGVSLFAAQIGGLIGARLLATTRSERKRAALERVGVASILDATRPKWGDEARKLAGGEGVDHVMEVGGAATLSESLRAVRPGGVISLVGVLGGDAAPSLTPVVMRNIRVQGVFVGHRASFLEMLAAFSKHRVQPVIDSVFPLSEAGRAIERLASGEHCGKIVLQVS